MARLTPIDHDPFAPAMSDDEALNERPSLLQRMPVAQTAQPAPSRTPKLTPVEGDPFAETGQQQDAPQQSKLAGGARAAGQGLTFGFGDEIAAGGRSLFGEDYDKALADERAKIAQFGEDHPWASLATEVAGGLPYAFIPGLNAANWLRNAGTATRAGHRAGTVGAAYAVPYGFGTGSGSAENRAWNAAQSAPFGYALGLPLGAIGHKAGSLVGGYRAAKNEAGPQGAYNAAARGLQQDRINVDEDIIAPMLPDKSRALTTEQLQDMMRRSAAGETQEQIAKNFASAKSQTGKVAPGTIGRNVREFERLNQTPLTIVDRAKLARPGAGQNTEWRMRAAAATPGDARRRAAESLYERQLGQGDRLIDTVQKNVAKGTDESIAGLQDNLRKLENQAYTSARASEQPFNISPILDKWNSKIAQEFKPSSGLGEGVKKALDNFYDTAQVVADDGRGLIPRHTPVQGLERFHGAKMELDDLISRSYENNRPTNLTRHLVQLKNDLIEEVGNANPQWKAANDLFTGAARDALKAGDKMAMRLNSRSREVLDDLAKFEKMAKSKNPNIKAAGEGQLQMLREAVSRKIQDTIQGKPETHDLTRTFLMPGAQKVLKRLLGKDADELLRIMKEEQIGTSTFRKLQGSQTTPLKEAIEDLREPEFISKWWEYMSPWKATEALAGQAAKRLSAKKNEGLMNILAEMDPVEQLNHLRALKNVTSARQQGALNAVRPVPATSGILAADEGQPQMKPLPSRQRRGYADGGGISPHLEKNPFGDWMEEEEAERFPDRAPDLGDVDTNRYWEDREPGMRERQQIAVDDFINPEGMQGPPERQRLSEGVGDIVNALQFNAPNAYDSISDLISNPSPSNIARTGFDVGMMPLQATPAAKAGKPGLDAVREILAKRLYDTGFGTMAGGTGLGMLGAMSEDAEARQRRRRMDEFEAEGVGQPEGSDPYTEMAREIGDDPVGQSLLSQLKAKEVEAKTDKPGLTRSAGTAARNRAAEEAATIRQQLIDHIVQLKEGSRPFSQAWEETNKTLPYVGLAGPALFGMTRGMGRRMGENAETGAWRGSARRAQSEIDALESGRPWYARWKGEPSVNKAVDNIKRAQGFKAANEASAGGAGKAVSDAATDALGGAAIGAESVALPHQYNLRMTDSDSQAYQDADRFFDEPVQNLGRAAGMGALTGFAGAHINPIPKLRKPTQETETLSNYLKPGRTDDVDAFMRNFDAGADASGTARKSRSARAHGVEQRQSGTEQLREPSGSPRAADQGLGRSSTGTGGLGDAPVHEARAAAASRRLKEKMRGPVEGRGIDDMPVQSERPVVNATRPKDAPPWYRDRHPAGTVGDDGIKIGGRFVASREASGASSRAGLTPAGQDAYRTVTGEIEGWIKANPGSTSIPRKTIQEITNRAAQGADDVDAKALLDAVMKYVSP